VDTGKVVTRYSWTLIPIPTAVIERVNELSKDQPTQLTLKISKVSQLGITMPLLRPMIAKIMSFQECQWVILTSQECMMGMLSISQEWIWLEPVEEQPTTVEEPTRLP
jgi:hypothetical protein